MTLLTSVGQNTWRITNGLVLIYNLQQLTLCRSMPHWHSPWRIARQLRGVTSVTKFAAVPPLHYIPTFTYQMKSMMTIVMKWTAVTPIKRVLHCLMDHPCWKEISRRKLWFPRSLVSHRGVLFIANLVEEKETAKPYKAWQSTGSYINK